MGMTIIEKIIASHSGKDIVRPGEIVDVEIDARVARDFGGPNVVKNMRENGLKIKDPNKTFFTFDTNPTGSDQKYAANQQICRVYARENNIKLYDINLGIGTHLLIEKGLVTPGDTAISTDSHANILGAIGVFGQGMGDKDVAVAWSKGSIWFKVPPSVKLYLKGKIPGKLSAKDIVLNLLNIFGANKLLGYSVELYGDDIDSLGLADRITIASMATEMGAIAIMITPDENILEYCREKSGKNVKAVIADGDAVYEQVIEVDAAGFDYKISRPGKPHDTVDLMNLNQVKIDSAFVGSCTNGRIEDMREVAGILKGKKVAPGVVLKIVPATAAIWDQCLDEGLIKIFRDAGALVSNAGCAGCAAGQVGQNGVGEITISTGNRNFPGKQGKGEVYLSSPATVAASAVAGIITDKDNIPDKPVLFKTGAVNDFTGKAATKQQAEDKSSLMRGRVWMIEMDNIDTDMIFHNRYLAVTDQSEMGKYAFDNLEGYEDFAKKVQKGDIVITGKNFGSGSSRQQAVDCFKVLGVQAIIAESFGAIYERNAVNAAFPILTYKDISSLGLKTGDSIELDLMKGELRNLENGKLEKITPFSEVQMEIYSKGGLF